ncbi:MAG TPA: hypothetical protein VHE81_06045 [Lacipirellulaceae bacterium]|nr:hypothetical protein [Lacipirellulaceae bacterium]
MLDENLGDALLKLDLSPKSDPPAAQVERIIDTDRRRVKRWTRIAIALWILAALGAAFIFVMGGLTFPVIAKMVMDENQTKVAKMTAKAGAADTADAVKARENAPGTLENPNTPFLVLAKLTAMTFVFGSASFLVLVLAGLATVLLLLRSRTATFRQINANLLQISEQLKRSPPASSAEA